MSLRVGLIGCGNWGRHILRDLAALDCEVAVVARSEASRERAVDGGAKEVVGEIEALDDLAGVVVATPETAHAATATRALALDVPVFCEKPLTVDPVSAANLAAAAPDRLFVMDKWRYHPGVELLRDIAASQELGEAIGVRCVRVGWGNAHPTSDSTWHLAPHDLSIALEVLGRLPDPRDAVAERVGELPTGLIGMLGTEPWVAIEVSSARRERRREVHLMCRDGIAWLPDAFAEAVGVCRGSRIGAEPEWRPIATEMPLLRELRAFVEHLGGGPPPRSGASDAAQIVSAVGQLRERAGLPAASPELA